MTADRTPLWMKQIRWHLTGKAGRSIDIRIRLEALRYKVGVGIADLLCRGNRWGAHTYDSWQPIGGRCLCDRVRRRLDYIPF